MPLMDDFAHDGEADETTDFYMETDNLIRGQFVTMPHLKFEWQKCVSDIRNMKYCQVSEWIKEQK